MIRAAPSARSGYRSSSADHGPPGNRTSDSRFQHLHDAADGAAVVHPLDAADIRRQERLDPLPLLVAQPKQIPAHNFKSFPPKNHYLIVSEKGLMSSDPSNYMRASSDHVGAPEVAPPTAI